MTALTEKWSWQDVFGSNFSVATEKHVYNIGPRNFSPVVRSICHEDVSLARAADAPRSAELPVLLALDAEGEDGRADVAVVPARANLDAEGAVLDVSVLDGHAQLKEKNEFEQM